MKNLFRILVLASVPLLFGVEAVAGMSIKPAIINFSGEPGGIYKVPIEIQNTSRNETEFLKLYAESSEVNRSGNWEFTRKRGGKKSMLEWIRLQQDEIALQPGEKTTIELLVKVPRGSAGDYRVALMVDQDATKMAPQAERASEDMEALLQLGRGRGATPQKTTAKIIKTMRVSIPVNVRIRDAKNRNWDRPMLKYGPVQVGIARGAGTGSFVMNSVVNNQGDYDTALQGACSVLHAKTKAKLKIAAIDEGGVSILPVSERLAQCHFEGSLPPGQYLAVMDLMQEVTDGGAPKSRQLQSPFTVSQQLSQQMQLLASPGGAESGRPRTPLMLTPGIVAQQPSGFRAKPFTVTVTNPTKRTLNVQTKFINRTYGKKNRPAVKVKPSRFKLEPGKSKRVKISVKSKGKSPAYGQLMLVAKETKGSIPATVPILIVPKKAKLVQKAAVTKINVEPDVAKKNLVFSAVLVNKGNSHFNDVAVELNLINFLGEKISAEAMRVGRELVLPKESGKLFLQKSLAQLRDDTYSAEIIAREGKRELSKEVIRFKLEKNSDGIVSLQ